MDIRKKNWNIIEDNFFDVVIIGGGINGASNYRELSRQGYKVLLVDKGDFSCGTSQTSAMMIWGGLLYLKNLAFLSVYRLSKDRDKIINSFHDRVTEKEFRYIANKEWGRNRYLVYFALQFYWMMGGFRRARPKFEKRFDELEFLNQNNSNESILYEEGFLRESDSRFVLDWILENQTEACVAINYCSIEQVSYNEKDKFWSIDLKDSIANRECKIRAKLILNCAGVWTDEVNQQFGIRSPYKHVFSKGVFIGYKRPQNHEKPLIFEMGEEGDTLTFIPWGPISLWGPTETKVNSIEEGFRIVPEDIEFLLKHASRNLKFSLAHSEIISMRCGLRPLAVKKNFKYDRYPLSISRNHKIAEDENLPWISVYGGKISGCLSLSAEVEKKIRKKVSPKLQAIGNIINNQKDETEWRTFPQLKDKVPSIDWCVKREFCCTLEDYLRRRTNISQWIPREGLGFQNENLEFLKDLASFLPNFENSSSDSIISQYARKVEQSFDNIIKKI